MPDLDSLDDAQRRQPPTYVPHRNLVLLYRDAGRLDESLALYRALEALVLDEGLEIERLYSRDDSLEAVFDYLVR